MHNKPWKYQFERLNWAITRLRAAHDRAKLNRKEFACYRDAALLGFDRVTYLFWQVLRQCLSYEGIDVEEFREVLSQSYMGKLIDNEKVWLDVIKNRDLATDAYKESIANRIFVGITTYLPVFEETYKNLEKRYEKV